jgi:dUTP pyrophosphatase
VIEVAVTRLRPEAALPSRAHAGDAGFDLVACEYVELHPGERVVVPTGIAIALPEGFSGFVQPRSGLAARAGITVLNSPGLIDSGYRGEVKVVLLNTDPEAIFVAEPGDRIAQLVVVRTPTVDLVEVESLPASARGTAGFGSTGA